jgi:hypothetical protein
MGMREVKKDLGTSKSFLVLATVVLGAAVIFLPCSATADASAQSAPGLARICLFDDAIHLKSTDKIVIPASTLFSDEGPNVGNPDNPDQWKLNGGERDWELAVLMTIEPVTLTQKSRCEPAKVQMATGRLGHLTSFTKAQNHLFVMDDIVDYPIPLQAPPIEFGKLIDDMSIGAILLSDVTLAKDVSPRQLSDTAKAAQCLDGAQKLAAFLGAAVGRQTSSMVELGELPAESISFGCGDAILHPDLYISWDNGAKPRPETLALIVRAGEFLTGATSDELKTNTVACLSEALKPDSGEMADRQFRGVKLECQDFIRDGGGGSITVYRRFGAYPQRDAPAPASLAALDEASSRMKTKEDLDRANALKFAQWFLDPAIPEKVKVFAMMAARVATLEKRCPTAKNHEAKINEWAQWAGIAPADLTSGGRYFALMFKTIGEMQKGAATESIGEACANAARYD